MESSNNFHVNDPSLTKGENLRALVLSIPVEEMFGSVTTYNTPENDASGKICQQLRTSARVIKKLKLDSTPNERKELICEEVKPPEPLIIQNVPKVRVNRPKVVWSLDDKAHFFDAIKEYGKDFDAIQDYMASKCKRKGSNTSEIVQIKTKEQIRHFYYRTLHKISKYLKFSEEVKKVVQEFYALINYGELRRKIGVTSEKICLKLNELVYRGATQIRIRGKTVRIKTPMCRTLRRLNLIDERPEEFKLPPKVIVELRPRDNDSWMYVQEMGQNPRVHCSLPLQKRLNVLLTYLNSRWRTPERCAYEKALLNNNEINGNTTQNSDETKYVPIYPTLHIAPKSGAPIQLPNISYSELVTNYRISLNAYEERMGITQRGELLWNASINSLRAHNKLLINKRGPKRSRNDSFGCTTDTTKPKSDTTDPGGGGTTPITENSDVADIIESVVNEIVNIKYEDNNSLSSPPPVVPPQPPDDTEEKIKIENLEAEQMCRDLKIETIRNGWSLEDSDSITIGQLYLMIGCDAKIVLEYWWEKHDDNIKKEVGEDGTCYAAENGEENSVALRKLLSLAKLYYRKERIECPCGHVCGITNHQRGNVNGNRNKNGNTTSSLSSKIHKLEARVTNVPEGASTMEEVSLTKITTSPMIDGVFRLPFTPASNFSVQQHNVIEAFKAKLDSLKPKFCQRRGRIVRPKQVVVQRTLPLLSKTGAAANDPASILSMKVIPQGSLASEFIPSQLKSKPITQQSTISPIQNVVEEEEQQKSTSPPPSVLPITSIETDDDNIIDDIPPPSPISTLLDIVDSINTKTEIVPISNSMDNSNSSTTFTDFLADTVRGIETPLSRSPSRLLKEDDAHWLNSEVADFSLSSFLGHLDASPIKSPATVDGNRIISGDDTRMSQDMEAQLQSLMGENSIDYMAKFADLAAQMASDNGKK